MKKVRFLSLLLCISIPLLCSCGSDTASDSAGKRVLKNRFKEMPCYALTDPTVDEMRQTAVNAMLDSVSVPWYVSENINYNKTGAAAGKTFKIKANQNYGGLPYSNGNVGVLHWLQFYDFDTGEIVGLDANEISHRYGNTCANCIIWAWRSVCSSVSATSCCDLVPRNGVYPVGKYSSSPNSLSFGTDIICEGNGREVMYESYADIKPADALVYVNDPETFKLHVIMATEPAVVKYNADGTIDGKNSYIYFADQNVGMLSYNSPFYVYENGLQMHYTGNRHSAVSFESLYRNDYIPVTPGEFIGKAEYRKATAYLNGETDKFEQLSRCRVRSNYNIITISAEVTSGKKTVLAEKLITSTSDVSRGKIDNIALSRIFMRDSFAETLKKGKTYGIKIDVLVGTGETLTVFEEQKEY